MASRSSTVIISSSPIAKMGGLLTLTIAEINGTWLPYWLASVPLAPKCDSHPCGGWPPNLVSTMGGTGSLLYYTKQSLTYIRHPLDNAEILLDYFATWIKTSPSLVWGGPGEISAKFCLAQSAASLLASSALSCVSKTLMPIPSSFPRLTKSYATKPGRLRRVGTKPSWIRRANSFREPGLALPRRMAAYIVCCSFLCVASFVVEMFALKLRYDAWKAIYNFSSVGCLVLVACLPA